MGSRTKVEAMVAPSFSVVDNSLVSLVLRVITFAKWTGYLPVIIAQNNVGLISLGFAGFRLSTFVWLSTFAFHCLLSFGYFEQYMSRFITPLRLVDVFIYVLVIFTFICSSLVIPRITLTRKHALESALNELLQVDSLLCGKLKDTTTCITASILFTLVALSLLTLNYVRLFYLLDWDTNELIQSSIYTFGTGSTLVGTFCYGFWLVYYFISVWIMPLQLYVLCRCLSRYFDCLVKKIRQDIYPDNNSFEVRVLQSAQMLNQDTNCSLIFTKRLQKLHEAVVRLVKAAQAVDEYFGLSMLLFVVSRLLNILLHLHSLSRSVSLISYGTTEKVFKSLHGSMIILRQVIELLFVIWVADSLPTAVKKCQQEVIDMPMPHVNLYELEAIKQTLERLESLQLQWFRNQIIGIKVKINAFGVFPISRELIPPIFGAIVTYFLILMQFTNDDGNKTAGKL